MKVRHESGCSSCPSRFLRDLISFDISIARDHCAGLFLATIEDDPQISGDIGVIKQEDISDLRKWIILNKSQLLLLWDDEISPLKAALIPINVHEDAADEPEST